MDVAMVGGVTLHGLEFPITALWAGIKAIPLPYLDE